MMAAIDVHVTHGGSIIGGEVNADARLVARCTLCGRDVESSASLAAGRTVAPASGPTSPPCAVACSGLCGPNS